MKLSLKTIINSVTGLQGLSNLKLPIVTSFKISKVLKQINAELETFNEVKNKRSDEMGLSEKKQEDITPEENKKWNEEIKELTSKEVDIDVTKIKLSELGEEKIEPYILSQLDWLIEE